MSSHTPTKTPRLLANHIPNDMPQQILSKWLFAQPAHEVTISSLASKNANLSHEQIDSILAIRKIIASTQQSHD